MRSFDAALAAIIFAAAACGFVLAAGVGPVGVQIGREVSVTHPLAEGDEHHLTVPQLLAHGEILFKANWTEQEGGGRPLTKGTGRPVSDSSQPLKGSRSFNRIS